MRAGKRRNRREHHDHIIIRHTVARRHPRPHRPGGRRQDGRRHAGGLAFARARSEIRDCVRAAADAGTEGTGKAWPAPQSDRCRRRRRRRGPCAGREAAGGGWRRDRAEALCGLRDRGAVDHGWHHASISGTGVRLQLGRARHAEYAGCDRPWHDRRGAEQKSHPAPAPTRRRAVVGDRRGRMDRQREFHGRRDRSVRFRTGLCVPAGGDAGEGRRRRRPAAGACDEARARNGGGLRANC